MAKPSAFRRLKTSEAPVSAATPPVKTQPAVTPIPQTQASRIGRKTVIFYDLPEAVRELKRLGIDQDKTIQALMHEAVDDLLVKYGKHTFGPR